jgi:predicted aspartyl protease
MHDKGMATYYVHAQIADLGISEFMVDTGSGYLTINEQTLNALQERKQVQYVKELRAILANGTELVIPVYAISQLRIGTCTLRNVEAAVFPARTRQILGLSALNKAAPFTFSVDPPELVLSNCARSKDTLLVSPALAEAAEPKGPSGNAGGTPLRP